MVGGPRGSSIISSEGIDSHLLIGDETALPAIGRRLEELPPGSRALVVIETADGAAGAIPWKAERRLQSNGLLVILRQPLRRTV